MSLPPAVRLDRLLANLGYGSRREVHALVRERAIFLDGQAVTDAGARIALTADIPERLTVRGAPVDPPAPLVLMMHKPAGVVCSHKEPGRSVYELLPPRWRSRTPALSTVGRLDRDTTGLLLITDDGSFLHRVISPRTHAPKRYTASLQWPLRGDEADIFARGDLLLEGEERPLAPAYLEVLEPRVARLTLTEGRYHQVRRMFSATGNRVVELHRDRIGSLDLPPDLAPGAWRALNPDEREAILAEDKCESPRLA
ncbi:MAG: pseudouridine synthase [Phenylobacterium sp.]|jgi:16S rRNA pseudouridine516 synthase|uniref:pseudouridine synthase n=1 Tax=Phenylobacterium sp. TaxID=1871053 RepID=UPI00391F8B7E